MRAGYRHRRNTAAVLALVLLSLALLAVFVMAAFEGARISYGVARRYCEHTIAQEAARAGLGRALHYMTSDPNWSDGFHAYPLSDLGATCSVTFLDGQPGVPRSTNNLLGAAARQAADGRVVPAGACHLVSVGTYQSTTATAEVLFRQGPLTSLPYGVAASGRVTLTATIADSYDSSRGTYADTVSPVGCAMRTNASNASSVALIGPTKWGGDVTVGPTGSAATVAVSSGSTLQGEVRVPAAHARLLSLRVPDGASGGDQSFTGGTVSLAPGVYGVLTLSDARLNLSGGAYVFDAIQATSSRIVVDDTASPVYCYSKGGVSMSATTVTNLASRPAGFWLVGAGAGTLTLALSGQTCMAVYAPEAKVFLSGGELFGGVAAAGVTCDGVSLHYDAVLRSTAGPAIEEILARWGD